MGIAAAMIFANFGAAYGTAKSGAGVFSISVLKPHLIFKAAVPVIMAGILGIYGLIVSIIISTHVSKEMSYYKGYLILASGMVCGFSCLASGLAIGISGDAGVRAYA